MAAKKKAAAKKAPAAKKAAAPAEAWRHRATKAGATKPQGSGPLAGT